MWGQVKSSFHSPYFIEQTAHYDHKTRAAWVYGALLTTLTPSLALAE